jgi:predicted glycosyltransferase
MNKAIWIDLDNSPHVPLFAPVIKRYRAEGQKVLLTARDFAQTVELLERAGLKGEFDVVGKHFGKNKFKKVFGLLWRAQELVDYVQAARKKGAEIGAALSHGSRAMVLAARRLGIPVITMYDYEYTETLIFNVLSHKVLVPEKIPDATLDAIGLAPKKRVKYSGYKEELYLRHYEADKHFLETVALDNNMTIDCSRIIVTLRPPASAANYHNDESEKILSKLTDKLLRRADVFTFILPRTAEQKLELEKHFAEKNYPKESHLIPKKAVNGLDLAFNSDLLISGGGTMNREAALLGVPVYSIFAGKQGALDKDMEACGVIRFIRSERDVEKIDLRKREPAQRNYIVSDAVEKRLRETVSLFL